MIAGAALFFVVVFLVAATVAALQRDRERKRLTSRWLDKREAHRQTTAEIFYLTEFTRRRALKRRMARRATR
jgi:hypothetical protein